MVYDLSRRQFGYGAAAACLTAATPVRALASGGRSAPVSLDLHGRTRIRADAGLRSSSLVQSETEGMWIDGWRDPAQTFSWAVNSPQQGPYVFRALVAAAPGSRIVVETASGTAEAIVPDSGDFWGNNWHSLDMSPALRLSKGVNEIRMRGDPIGGAKTARQTKGAALLGVELIPAGDVAQEKRRIVAGRSDASWMGDAAYGLMLQWGEWGYPQHGDKAQWPAQIDRFNVDRFVEMVSQTGAGYVIWSVTWRSYYFPAPIRSIDTIISGRTCERDLVRELGDALKKRGIRLILYYNGIAPDDEWRRMAGYPGPNASLEERSAFDAKWFKVVEEVGARYGDLLAGWFIDEGDYPRDFERANAALKTGSSDRIIGFNSWVRCRTTDFQDFYPGEGVDLRLKRDLEGPFLATIDPATGRFKNGSQAGLQSHGCFLLDTQSTLTDWGIWKPDSQITAPLISEADIRRMAHLAVNYRYALSFNIMMFEDGSVSEQSLARLALMKECVAAEKAKRTS